MVKQKDIFKAINLLLIDLYPEYTVHIQSCPKDFVPSSFKIEFVHVSEVDKCRTTVEKTVYYTITCFASKDEYYRTNPEELTDIQETILIKLQKGYLTVGDRAIKVKASTGGIDKDRAYIDLQLEFCDNRTDEEDQTPLATSVNTRIQEV
jgi:hypothetical protein